MQQKIKCQFSEETIERISERAAQRITDQLDEFVINGISFQLLDDDTLSAITEAMRNIDGPNMDKIEICVHSARGQLYAAVKHKTLEKVLQIILAELKIAEVKMIKERDNETEVQQG